MKFIINETKELLDHIFEEDDSQFMSAFEKLEDLDPEKVVDMDEDDEIGIDDNSDVDDSGEFIHPDDIEILWDIEVGDTEEELGEALKKSAPKNPKEILRNRFKRKSRLYILSEGGKNATITPLMIAKFNEKFEWDEKMGRFGKWRIRKNRTEYKKNNPLKDAVKKIKKKKKILKKIKKKGSVQAKMARSATRTARRLGGKDVDAQGNIVKD